MSNFRKQVIRSIAIAATCLSWISCGTGSPRPQCQGATCSPTTSTYLYVTALDDISGFTIGASGAPASPRHQAGPNQSIGIVADPSGKYLYVSDFENSTIQAYSINQTTGAMTPVAGSPFSAGGPADAGGLAVDPHGKFVYVTLGNSNAIAGFSTTPTTGVLSPIVGSPFATGSTPVQAMADPSGKFLYVSLLNDSQGAIAAYTIDPSSGALNIIPGSPFATQANFPGPWGLALGGGGKFLYVAMIGTVNANNVVSGFSIDATTGVLTPLAGSPFPSGQGPVRLASDPVGKFLFAVNIVDDTVSAFAVNSTSGALTTVAGSPFPTHSAPFDVVVDPTGKFVYVANSGSGDLSVFSLDSTSGTLTPLAGSPFSTGQQEPGGLAIVKTQ